MKKPIKAVFLLIIVSALSACASTGGRGAIPPQIGHAPAIDVPYEDVAKNVQGHVGVNVRWGGQVIAAQDVGDKTRLTVLAYPLTAEGRPVLKTVNGFRGGRSIVETDAQSKNFDPNNSREYLTIYGRVSSEEVLTNGKFEKVIPVVTEIESKTWNLYNRERYAGRHPYHGLGFSVGLGRGFGFPSFGLSYSDYYGGFGLNYNLYPYRFAYSGSKRSHRGRR